MTDQQDAAFLRTFGLVLGFRSSGRLAAAFWQQPSQRFQVIGVTEMNVKIDAKE